MFCSWVLWLLFYGWLLLDFKIKPYFDTLFSFRFWGLSYLIIWSGAKTRCRGFPCLWITKEIVFAWWCFFVWFCKLVCSGECQFASTVCRTILVLYFCLRWNFDWNVSCNSFMSISCHGMKTTVMLVQLFCFMENMYRSYDLRLINMWKDKLNIAAIVYVLWTFYGISYYIVSCHWRCSPH